MSPPAFGASGSSTPIGSVVAGNVAGIYAQADRSRRTMMVLKAYLSAQRMAMPDPYPYLAYPIVQINQAVSSGLVGSLSFSYQQPTTPGNWLIAACGNGSSSGQPTGVATVMTPPAGWMIVAYAENSNFAGILVAAAPADGGQTYTFTTKPNTGLNIICYEITDVDMASQQGGGQFWPIHKALGGAGAGLTYTSPSVTP